MNKIMIKMINAYKKNTANKNPTCRYHPSCSTYSKHAFEKHNFFYASILSVWRILRCNPLSKGGYDPVPKTKREKNQEETEQL